jgi:hypothetical protein
MAPSNTKNTNTIKRASGITEKTPRNKEHLGDRSEPTLFIIKILLFKKQYGIVLFVMNKTVVIEDTRQGNESGANLLRRFSRRVKDSNLVRNVRNRRYAQRKASDLVTKRSALRRIAKMQEIVKLRKLGKIK